MKGEYPRFRASYARDELVVQFLLTPQDHELIAHCRGDVNRYGVAILLKSLPYLGYFPNDLRNVPREVREFIVHQLHLPWDFSNFYPADERTRGYHHVLIRKHTGWRAVTAQDKKDLARWLRTEAALDAPTEEDLLEHAYERLRAVQIELPAEKELRRLVSAALRGFFQDLYVRISTRISPSVRAHVDTLLVVPPDDSVSAFEKLKVDPARPGVENLKTEITKLQTLRVRGHDIVDINWTRHRGLNNWA